jgi:hypothetical protein
MNYKENKEKGKKSQSFSFGILESKALALEFFGFCFLFTLKNV